MESFDAEIDSVLDSLPFSAPCSNLSDSLFLSEEIDTIDEQWWQQLTLPSPKHEGGLEDPEEGAFLADENTGCGAISSSCSSPNVTSTSQPDVAAAPSSSLTKRSADSSPEFEQDDPKRLRRCLSFLFLCCFYWFFSTVIFDVETRRKFCHDRSSV